jgi:hypothetical protein
VVQSAIFGADTRVAGQLRSTPGSVFTIDFYASPAADPSGFGEGQRWLGAIQATTDTLGVAGFSTDLAGALVDEFITATATSATGSTSEFSEAQVVRGRPDRGRALTASALPSVPLAESLSISQLTPIVKEAVARWQMTGVHISSLNHVEFVITDLSDDLLGLAVGHTIWLDANAAGWGWFVDPTPSDDAEFVTAGDQGELDRMDLLSAVMHELGHVLGLEHEEADVMRETLSTGTRTSLGQFSERDWLLGVEAMMAELNAGSGILKGRGS